jgi:cation diffusion facilitator family transporter
VAGGSKTVVYAALIGNSLIAVLKFIVALMTRSSAMLAEAFHSTADAGNQALLLVGIRRSKKPPTPEHPFGFGKEQFFWSFVVANVLFFLGAAASIFEGVKKLMHPHPMEKFHLIYIVLGISIVVEAVAYTMAIRQFNRSRGDKPVWQALKDEKDANLLVVLVEDTAATLGLVVALVGVMLVDLTGKLYFDAVASIIIGLILASVAAFLANEMRKLLIGEGVGPRKLKAIKEALESFDEVDSLMNIYTMYIGPRHVLLAVEVDFHDHVSAGELEKVIASMEAKAVEVMPDIRKVFIEAQAVARTAAG